MTSYEFWEELSKIFNAVVSYQEKSIEFNNRFITPWVRLGNVFDKEEHQREELASYKKAVEMDPGNAQLWFELGNLFLKKSEYEDALQAFRRAIELNPDMGGAYSNLGTVYMSCGNYEKAVESFERSIVLFEDDKDKAMSWNRLGNLYRKTNRYSLALEAFQRADELDATSCLAVVDANIPSNNQIKEQTLETEPQIGVAEAKDQVLETEEPVVIFKAEEELSLETEESVVTFEAEEELSLETEEPVVTFEVQEELSLETEEPVVTFEAQEELSPEAEVQVVATETEELALKTEAPVAVAETQEEQTLETKALVVALETQEVQASESEPQIVATETEELTKDYPQVTEINTAVFMVAGTTTISATDLQEISDLEADLETDESRLLIDGEVEAERAEEHQKAQVETQNDVLEMITEITQLAQQKEVAETLNESNEAASSDKVAYEEFLNDEESRFPFPAADEELTAVNSKSEGAVDSTPDPVTIIDSFGDVQMEVDINNAKVWNELGNVYYGNGALEDAIVAYAKSIELDRNFAWPYSNLAMVYVQKGRLAEAVLLYQRSIELFIDDKDKAVAWNCLGNVYRRVDDYSNAISAYQRADDLDPNNISSSFQSRYSLLGTLTQMQESAIAQG